MSDAMKQHTYIRLAITGRAEDVPRLIMAYGRVRDANHPGAGEWALAIDPHQGTAFVCHIKPNGDVAHVWSGGGSGHKTDAPRKPTREMAVRAAIHVLKTTERTASRTAGPSVVRGQWSGKLKICGETGEPHVELERAITSYGKLTVISGHAPGWRWTFHRAGKWFTSEGAVQGAELEHDLVSAMQQGTAGALGLIREACGRRDTTRRDAVDKEYAAKHPRKPVKEPRDPTARVKERKPKKPKGKGKKEWTAAEREAFKAKMAAARAAAAKKKNGGAAKPKKNGGKKKKAAAAPAAPPAPRKHKHKKKGNGGSTAAKEAQLGRIMGEALQQAMSAS